MDATRPEAGELRRRARLRSYGLATIIVAAATVVAILVRPHLELADIVMVYLVGIILVSTRVGYGPSLYAALLSVASLDFFCVPPILTFAVTDLEHVVTFAVMLLVAVVMTTLTDRVRQHAVAATERERQTAALYAVSRELASTRGRARLASVAAQHMARVFDAQVVFFLPTEEGHLAAVPTGEAAYPIDDKDLGAAEWAFSHKEPAGLGSDTLPGARALYLPLVASRGAVGVVGLAPAPGERFLQQERVLRDAFTSQAAVAIERAVLAGEAERARLQAESEHLRNTLFSSVSHDLRTPLAAITGAAAVLRDDSAAFSATQRELVDTIYVQGDRLGRLLTNLLEMARLESGPLMLRREWQPVEEVIGSAIHRLEKRLAGRTVTADVTPGLPLAELDAALMEQALLNVLENAIKYTPAGSPIDVTARPEGNDAIVVEIADRGAGIPAGEEERIFEKFRRADSSGVPGFGLGLTICRGIVEAHGGRVVARNRAGGGAVFRLWLPVTGKPPAVRDSEAEIASAE
jgi:two-component system sensor histidine kinase KdpD